MTPGSRGDGPPERVRVTGPPRQPGRARRPGARDIDAGTRIGAIFMGSLLAEQRRLALWVLGLLAATVGALPLLFHLAPGLTDVRFLGMPLPWLLLGVLVHPLLLVLGWGYVRRAEENEQDFAELVAEALPDSEAEER